MTMRLLPLLLLSVPLAAAQQPDATPPSPDVVAAAQPAAAQPPLSRLEAYDQFRALFQTGRYAEALPHAQRVVELTIQEQDGASDELPIAYNNLGATQLRLGDHEGAGESYRTSLELLEMTEGISSRRLIPPLAGLAAVHASQGQHALAIEHLHRATAVSRRANGLFNLEQLGLLEQSVVSYHALGEPAGVEANYRYAAQIAEQNYGPNDPRVLPFLARLAELYEAESHFIPARAVYLRMRDISMHEGGGFNPDTVIALLGVGRTHRMQFVHDPDSLEEPIGGLARDPVTKRPLLPNAVPLATGFVNPPRPERSGQKAIERAIEMLRQASDPPPELLAAALMEMGDWLMASRRPDSAVPYYREAAQVFPVAADNPNPLDQPRLVFYRPPAASSRDRFTIQGNIVARTAEMKLTVGADGRTRDIVVESTDMSDFQLAQIRRALDHAVFSPRIEDGQPVETAGVPFRGVWYELEPAATDSAAGG